jgi:predicted RNase H-like nuclease (RuvC/YqgF family)
MTTTHVSEIQIDHKHWLRDIDRWDAYLRVWQNQIDELKREYRRMLKTVDEHADNLGEFAECLDSHRRKLLSDERASVEHPFKDAAPVELVHRHDANTSQHDDLYKFHERLKQMQHTLLSGLAVLKHEPYPED